MADQSQRSRSVYIGNLPWDVKEDELKKIFSQVGTIVSLRMPNDPESGRSRGFAFCEYRDTESVNVAIKHFNGYELNGRKIRVDSAANNQDKDSKISGPVANDSQFGEPCDPVKAPEVIASVIGKMSPQQIQAIISESKRCLQGDPEEARVALVNNPQMTYALLLALVRGRYITKERGTEALVKPEPPLLPIFPEARAPFPPGPRMVMPMHPGGPGGHPGGHLPQMGPGPMPPLHMYGPGLAQSSHVNHGNLPHQQQPMHSDHRTRFGPPVLTPAAVRSPRVVSPSPPPAAASREEQEKAELIMQVLRLKEDDITKMAPEQQRTVRMLREQFKSISK